MKPSQILRNPGRGARRAPSWPAWSGTWLLLALASLLAAGAAASTLSPGHPVWQMEGIDHASLREAWVAQRARHAKGAVLASAPAFDKGYRAHRNRMLVIPVLFADSSGPPLARQTLERRFFDLDDPGSVASYFHEASGGRFVPEGIVLDWVRLPGTLTTYPDAGCYPYANIIGGAQTNDGGVMCMVRDALRQAQTLLDLSAFDDDGPDGLPGSGDDDGRIDLLVVLHPDTGFEVDPDPSNRSRAILAHQGRVDVDPLLVADPGVVGDAYVVASAFGPLGVWVHEIGHLLGLEDLYDYDVRGPLPESPHRGGLGLWSLMAHGTWGGEGERPSNLDALSRRRLGWEDRPVVISGPARVLLDPVEGGNAGSVEVRPLGAWERERFVLENRVRRDGVVDGALPGSGVLAYRVDDALRRNESSEGYWVRLLQADGLWDLEELRNNGDAGDPYTGQAGADLLGPDTNPSSRSHVASLDRIPPVIRVGPPEAGGVQPVDVDLSETAALRFAGAFFLDANQNHRFHLRRGETAAWHLRFESVGADHTAAEITLQVFDPRLEIEVAGEPPYPMVERGGWWVPEPAITVRDTDPLSDPTSVLVDLGIGVPGGPARTVRVGLPVRDGPGLAADLFRVWEPAVLAAEADTTRFTSLSILDLPLPTDAGWETTTRGEPGYADGVELTLTSPWFAIPRAGAMKFWSRHQTEGSQPGQAWDGGVLEVLHPDHGWRPLVPEGGPTVLINHHSRAATRGEVGLGGPPAGWQGYDASLPPLESPTRVRLRFASDAESTAVGWAVAGMGTDPAPGRARITLSRGPLGELLADATFTGYFSPRVTTVRFRYRRPLGGPWEPASPLLTLTSDLQPIRVALEVPPQESVLRISLFAEAVSAAPTLLLGSVGYKNEAATVTRLRAHPNPAQGRLFLELTASERPQRVEVFDLRGRRVRTLHVIPFVRRVEWRGEDDRGRRVAAGRYVAVLGSDTSVRASFVWVP